MSGYNIRDTVVMAQPIPSDHCRYFKWLEVK